MNVSNKSVIELLNEMRSSGDYYILLFLSIFIISIGIILNNALIFLSGVLVFPFLVSISTLAIGICISNKKIIRQSFFSLSKSVLLALLFSYIIGFLISKSDFFIFYKKIILSYSFKIFILFFILSLVVGVSATHALINKKIKNLFSGVAISLVLSTTLSATGVLWGAGEFYHALFFLLLFLVNLGGVLLGSIFVFNMLCSSEVFLKEGEKEVKL